MGKSVKAPPAPDYKGAAEATAASNKEAAVYNTAANRPNINTPFGSQSWTSEAGVDPATGQKITNWTQNTTLDPKAQAALDSQMAMQQGRSDLANSTMPRVAESINKPFDFSGMKEWGDGYTGAGPNKNFQTSVPTTTGNFQNFQSSVPTNTDKFTGYQSSVDKTSGNFKDFQSSVPTTTSNIQTGVGNTPAYINQSGNAIYNQATSRLDPRFSQAQSDLDSRLANQGITAGSEAYNRAQNNMSMQRNDAYQTAMNSATAQAASDASRIQGMDLNAGNFGNSAQNQIFNQNLNAGNFANQSASLSNQMQNQAFAQNLQAGEFANRASDQNNNSLNQQFNQNLNAGNFANQSAAANNTAQNQIFNQNLTAGNFGNQAINYGNQAQQQDYTQQMGQSNYDNTLRQAQFAMQNQERLQPLNEMNALVTGQQVGMPQMPSFNNATPFQGVNYSGAATQQGQYDMNTFNAQQAANGGMMSGLFSLGGSAMMAGAMSDKRLKKIIQRVGKLANGLNVYRFKYLGMPGVHTGVMAQDVARVRPDCVIQTSSGFMAVNYSKLLGA
jgi:hypothetical protein